MKLFLTSNGIVEELTSSFLKLINQDPSNITLAFIPTAGHNPNDIAYQAKLVPENYKNEDTGLIAQSLNCLKQFGFNLKIVDITPIEGQDKQTSINKLTSELTGVDIIYVNAGNTFYLMDCINKSGFKDVITKLDKTRSKQNQIIYVGASAGSIVAGIDISVAGWHPNWDQNFINLKDFTGMGLVPYMISPHFIENDRVVIANNIKDKNNFIIAINNRQALQRSDGKTTLIGEPEKVIYGADWPN